MASVTQYYLEKCRTKLTAELGKEATDYQLSKKLNLSTSTINRYTKHGFEADDDAAFKIAQFAQIPAIEIIAKIHAEKVKSPELQRLFAALASSAKKLDQYILCKIPFLFPSPINPYSKRVNFGL